MGSVSCLSLHILLSIMRVSSHLMPITIVCSCSFLPCNYLLPSWEGRGLGPAGLCPSCGRIPWMDQHGSHFLAKYFSKYWIIGEDWQDGFFTTWVISDHFKEVYLAQTSPRASHLTERRPAAIWCTMLLLGRGGSCRFLTNHLLHCIFLKETGCLLNKPWNFCKCCPERLV